MSRHRATPDRRFQPLIAMAVVGTLVVTLLQVAGFGPFASESSQALDGPPTTITLVSDSETFLAGQTFTLTATTDQAVEDTSSVIDIVDSTTYTTLISCTSGTVCDVEATFLDGDPHVYVATVGSLSSDVVTVAREAWTVELEAARSSTIAGQTSQLTATANQNVSNTGGSFVIDIFDVTAGVRLKSCTTGQVCSVSSPVFYQYDDTYQHEFVAVVAAPSTAAAAGDSVNAQATSSSVVVSRGGWTIDLGTNLSTVGVGDDVILTATLNQNVGLTYGKLALYIIDVSHGQSIGICYLGTVCRLTTPYMQVAEDNNNAVYMAFVAEPGAVAPANPSELTGIQGASAPASVALSPWDPELSANREVAGAGQSIVLTTTLAQDIGASGGGLSVYAITSDRGIVGTCSTGTTCTITDTYYTHNDNLHYDNLYYVIVAPSGLTDLDSVPGGYWSTMSNMVRVDRKVWDMNLAMATSSQVVVTLNQNVGLTNGNLIIELMESQRPIYLRYDDPLTPDVNEEEVLSFPDVVIGSCSTGKRCVFDIAPTSQTIHSEIRIVPRPSRPGWWTDTSMSSTGNSYYSPITPGQPLGPSLAHESTGGSNASENPCTCGHGDPVNSSTGEFFLPVNDLVLSGIGPALTASRTYSTANADADGLFGYGWVSSLNAKLEILIDGTTADPRPKEVQVIQENGAAVLFTLRDDVYTPPERVFATLEYDDVAESWEFVRRRAEVLTFDANGGLSSMADTYGNAVTVTRDLDGQITDAAASGGRTLEFEWTGDHVTSITDSAGRTTDYTYDAAGNLESATGPDGSVSTYIYDSQHRMTNLSVPGGAVTTNEYDTQGRVIAQTDPLERVTTFSYEGSYTVITSPDGSQQREEYIDGVLVSQILAYGTAVEAEISYTYDAMLNVISVVDARGGVTTATYDENGNALTRTDALGNVTTWTYDADGHPTSSTDPIGRVSTATYDASGKVISTTSPSGRVVSWTYNPNGTVATTTDTTGKVTSYTYNAAGLVTSTTDPDGRTSYFEYDLAGNSTGVTGPDGSAAVTVSDVQGRVLSITDPLGAVVSYGYDAAGNRDTVIAADLAETSSTFDAAGQVTSVTDAAGQVTLYTYTPTGQVATVTDANNHTTTNTYDARGNLVTTTDALNRTTAYEYDISGNLVKTTLPSGAFALAVYNAGQQLTSTTDANGQSTVYAYDAAGQLTSITDPLGRVTTTAYNLDGEPATVTNADESTVVYAYDSGGRVTSFTNADGKVTSYTYTASGQPASKTEPGGLVTSYSYEEAGRLEVVTLPDASTITYEYDLAGKTTGLDFSDPAETDVDYTYDLGGRVTGITDSTGTTSLAYDVTGQLTEEEDGSGQAIGYDYNDVGQMTTLTYPSGHEVDYTYDAAGQVTAVTDWANRVTSFTYTLDGYLATQTTPNGVTQATGYDAAGQLTSIGLSAGSTAIASFDYGYDFAGQLTSTEATNGGTTKSLDFAYDDITQLSSVATTTAGSTTTDSLDASSAGLLTQTQRGETLTYNAAQQLAALTPIFNPEVTYTYDPNGSRISATTAAMPSAASTSTTYSYSPSAKLESVTTPSTTVGYTVDARGLRQTRTEGATTDQFAWSSASNLPLMLTDGSKEYIYGVSVTPIAQLDLTTSAVEYLGTDMLGSVRVLTDSTGEPVATADYDAFGKVIATTGSVTSDFGFTGNWTDDDTGLVHLRARDYDPATGQFLTIDPAVEQTRQPYAYTGNNPITRTDPSGLTWWDELMSFGHDATMAVSAFGTGAMDSLTGGASTALLDMATGGYMSDCFIPEHQGAFAAGQVAGVVIEVASFVVAIVTTGAAGVSYVASRMALKAAIKSAPDIAVAGVKGSVDEGVSVATNALTRGTRGDVPSGAGNNPPVAIGEDMAGRVQPFADSIGAQTYKADPSAPRSMWMQNNKDWINQKMDEGCTIIDCGPAPGRANYPNATSEYYAMELEQLASRQYPVHKAF